MKTDGSFLPEGNTVIDPTTTQKDSQDDELLLSRRKRWDLLDGVLLWTSGFNFLMPITVGLLNYSSNMGQADQVAALVHCLTVSFKQ